MHTDLPALILELVSPFYTFTIWTHPMRKEKDCEERIVTQSSNCYETATLNRKKNHVISTCLRPVYTSLAWYRTTSCHNHATGHCFQRPSHLWRFSTRKKGRTVTLTTNSYNCQFKIREQYQLYWRQLKIFHEHDRYAGENTNHTRDQKIFIRPNTEHCVMVTIKASVLE